MQNTNGNKIIYKSRMTHVMDLPEEKLTRPGPGVEPGYGLPPPTHPHVEASVKNWRIKYQVLAAQNIPRPPTSLPPPGT